MLEGALEHKDSLGNGSEIRPGDVQRMSAGTGVTHSEYNPSPAEPLHFLQIWILPEIRGLTPSYEQRRFPEAAWVPLRRDPTGRGRSSAGDLAVPRAPLGGRARLIASRGGREGSVTIHQNANVYASLLAAGERFSHPLGSGRPAWVQAARGTVFVNGHEMSAGDGAQARAERALEVRATESAEVLLFDLA